MRMYRVTVNHELHGREEVQVLACSPEDALIWARSLHGGEVELVLDTHETGRGGELSLDEEWS